MWYEEIDKRIVQVYRECDIHSFPINCYQIIEHYGLKCCPYSDQTDELMNFCTNLSDDSFIYKTRIFYNDSPSIPSGRLRFSLMHEFGHYILGHTKNRSPLEEREANYFSSRMLAPRIAIHYSHCRNQMDVARRFEMTYAAAEYAFNDYWKSRSRYLGGAQTDNDRMLYQHFYVEEAGEFVYRITECKYCGKPLYNTEQDHCPGCRRAPYYARCNSHAPAAADPDFLIAEDQWLYGQ